MHCCQLGNTYISLFWQKGNLCALRAAQDLWWLWRPKGPTVVECDVIITSKLLVNSIQTFTQLFSKEHLNFVKMILQLFMNGSQLLKYHIDTLKYFLFSFFYMWTIEYVRFDLKKYPNVFSLLTIKVFRNWDFFR